MARRAGVVPLKYPTTSNSIRIGGLFLRMPRPATELTAAEIATLEACCAGGPHPRQRRRAQAILAHSRGLQLPQLARVFAVDYTTAHAWLQAWERRGIAGLAEGARAGRPPLLDAAAKKK